MPPVDRDMKRTGTTLVELVFVVTLLSVLAFVMIPRFDAYREVELRAAVKDAAADIRYAQAQAIATRVRHGVVFDPAGGGYTVFRGDPATPAPDFLDRGRPMRRTWDDIAVVAASFDGAAWIEFDSMGVPYNAAGDELAGAGVAVFSDGSHADTVTVQPLTGRLEY